MLDLTSAPPSRPHPGRLLAVAWASALIAVGALTTGCSEPTSAGSAWRIDAVSCDGIGTTWTAVVANLTPTSSLIVELRGGEPDEPWTLEGPNGPRRISEADVDRQPVEVGWPSDAALVAPRDECAIDLHPLG